MEIILKQLEDTTQNMNKILSLLNKSTINHDNNSLSLNNTLYITNIDEIIHLILLTIEILMNTTRQSNKLLIREKQTIELINELKQTIMKQSNIIKIQDIKPIKEDQSTMTEQVLILDISIYKSPKEYELEINQLNNDIQQLKDLNENLSNDLINSKKDNKKLKSVIKKSRLYMEAQSAQLESLLSQQFSESVKSSRSDIDKYNHIICNNKSPVDNNNIYSNDETFSNSNINYNNNNDYLNTNDFNNHPYSDKLTTDDVNISNKVSDKVPDKANNEIEHKLKYNNDNHTNNNNEAVNQSDRYSNNSNHNLSNKTEENISSYADVANINTVVNESSNNLYVSEESNDNEIEISPVVSQSIDSSNRCSVIGLSLINSKSLSDPSTFSSSSDSNKYSNTDVKNSIDWSIVSQRTEDSFELIRKYYNT